MSSEGLELTMPGIELLQTFALGPTATGIVCL
jgi:hypothetical protein